MKEMIPRGLPSPVAPMSTGSEGAHSSTTKSVDASQGVQWNDDELGNPSAGHADPGGYDPNMSGPRPTEPARDWQAGPMTSFQQNDDYLENFPCGSVSVR